LAQQPQRPPKHVCVQKVVSRSRKSHPLERIFFRRRKILKKKKFKLMKGVDVKGIQQMPTHGWTKDSLMETILLKTGAACAKSPYMPNEVMIMSVGLMTLNIETSIFMALKSCPTRDNFALDMKKVPVVCGCDMRPDGVMECPHLWAHGVLRDIRECGGVPPDGYAWIAANVMDVSPCGVLTIFRALQLFHYETRKILPAARNHRDRCRVLWCQNAQKARCSVCMHPEIRYCSAECQKADWPFHKHVCRAPPQEAVVDDETETTEEQDVD
jgi:hypothetical protein